jgi:hypothetical protein
MLYTLCYMQYAMSMSAPALVLYTGPGLLPGRNCFLCQLPLCFYKKSKAVITRWLLAICRSMLHDYRASAHTAAGGCLTDRTITPALPMPYTGGRVDSASRTSSPDEGRGAYAK